MLFLYLTEYHTSATCWVCFISSVPVRMKQNKAVVWGSCFPQYYDVDIDIQIGGHVVIGVGVNFGVHIRIGVVVGVDIDIDVEGTKS